MRGAARAVGSQAALARVMGVSSRKVRFMLAGQRKLWLGRTIPVPITAAEKHFLRQLLHETHR